MSIKPIHTERDYEHALKRIDQLWEAKRGTPQGDEMEVLLTLVSAYEQEHHPIPPPSPVEAIKFRMEQSGMTKADLGRYLGSRSRVTELLSGKRKLTVRMMKILYHELGVPPEALLAE